MSRLTALGAIAGVAALIGCSSLSTQSEPEIALAAIGSGPSPSISVYGIKSDNRSCNGSAFRQFDFWVGDWQVEAPPSPTTVSRITKELDGCGVFEFFQGGFGRSFSRFDRRTRTWYQDYVDNTGLTLRLFGGIREGEMAMRDSLRPIPGGPTLASLFRWTPRADGTVRQLWNFSLDGGATYTVNFDGVYSRHPAYQDPTPPAVGRCATDSYRAADGFLGSWSVATSEGQVLGTATLGLGAASCLIEETFRGQRGFEQRAFLYFDRFIQTWYRAQGDNRANTIELGGGFNNGALAMNAAVPDGDGRATPVRLTWLQPSPTQMTQLWEVQDRAGTWATIASLVWSRLP